MESLKLIAIYLYICEVYDKEVFVIANAFIGMVSNFRLVTKNNRRFICLP